MNRLTFVACLSALAGCYGPNIPNGQQQCSSDNKCADGYTCGPNHLCYKNGQVPTGDMSMVGAHDMAGAVVDLCMQQPDLATAPDFATPPCASDNDCASTPSTPRCDTGSGHCVACLATNDNCPSGSYCDSTSFTCMQGCKGDSDCMGDAGTNACCNHVCVDTTTDKNNCGGCGMACANGTNACCASKCVDTTSDPANCGGCGMGCSTLHIANPTCGSGVCNGACDTGFSDCNNDKRTDGCEINSAVDVMNCGGCGVACSTNNVTPVCASGSCQPGICATGFADCNGNKQIDGCEINIAGDKSNCGACGKVCSSTNMATVSCGGGVCNGTCANGFADCNNNKQTDGCEVATSSDTNNCGACGKVCSTSHMATVTCGGGVCNGTCAMGFTDCNNNKQTDGCEANLTADANNCGTCGKSCNGGSCVASACGIDIGPSHTFAGLTSTHFITQFGCSPSGGASDTTDATYFCQHFYDTSCSPVSFTKGPTATATDAKMHKDGGCTVNGSDIPGKTCDLNGSDSACKIGNWSETTTGLNNPVCHCSHYFTDNFVQGQVPTAQCTDWNNWRAGLSSTYSYLNIRGSLDPVGVTCTGAAANTLCQALHSGTAVTGVACGGRTWNVGSCGSAPEISADGTTCACDTTGYIVRPCVATANFGSAGGATCNGPNQSLTVTCL